MRSTEKLEGQSQLRDRLARERTQLAIERTFLAYIRTALAFVVVGIPALLLFEAVAIQLLGALSLFFGVVVVVFALFRYSQVKGNLHGLTKLDNDEDG